jgi:hypothetical protein
VETAKGDAMRKLICALLLALFVGGVISCKKETTPPAGEKGTTEKPAEKAPEEAPK